MSEEALFALRALALVFLYAFVGVLFFLLWRDYRTTAALTDAQRRAYGRLVVINAPDGFAPEGSAFPLRALTTFGRAPTNVVVVHDAFASHEHATLTLRGGRWWLQDQNSSNGTTLNGHPITGPTILSAGDVIGIGQTQFRLELD